MLLSNIKKFEDSLNDKLENPALLNEELYSNSLQLYVKKYNFEGTLSKYLNEYNTGNGSSSKDDIHVVGPIGVGLDIDSKLSGVYICMAGGTGAYCFLDFVAFILRYIVSRISKKLQIPNNSIDKEESYDEISDDFTLVYMSSFSNQDEGVYVAECQALQELDLKYNLNMFKFINRFSDDNPRPSRWNDIMLKKELGQFKDKIKKVFLCGPTPFLDDSKLNLLKSGLVTKSQIKFV